MAGIDRDYVALCARPMEVAERFAGRTLVQVQPVLAESIMQCLYGGVRKAKVKTVQRQILIGVQPEVSRHSLVEASLTDDADVVAPCCIEILPRLLWNDAAMEQLLAAASPIAAHSRCPAAAERLV